MLIILMAKTDTVAKLWFCNRNRNHQPSTNNRSHQPSTINHRALWWITFGF
jgi:hypothetical protein